jgi:hypothetical protein
MAEDIKKHPKPVWRAKANYTLIMKIDSDDDVLRHEEIWARQVTNELFEICCIPFFIYDIHLGDIVRIRPHGDRNIVEGTMTPSGHHTFRVWFKTFSVAAREQLLTDLRDLSCEMEWFSDELLAIDAADDLTSLQVVRMLEDLLKQGALDYETGRTA